MSSRDAARRFHFLREIASGGFGTVYLAKVMHADGFSRVAAVKILKSQWTDSEEVARRMRDEARLLGLLRHRNIVDVIDLTSIDGRAAVIMEYLEAVDLRTITRELAAAHQKVPVKSALEITAAVASALDAAYNRPPMPGDKPLRVIHRDIKPSNVMVDDTGMVKVLDFGVARSEIENRESHTQDLQFGSVDYMAPERLFFEPETPASDVYSLGASLFEILALDKLGKARGRPERHAAFLSERMGVLRSWLSLSGSAGIELQSLLKACLDFDHEKRPTAAELYQRARALSRLFDDEDIASWSEHTLGPMIRRHAEAHQGEGNLTDQVVTEDSVVLHATDQVDSDGRPIPRAVQLGPSSPLLPDVEAERRLADELRRGSLAELEESLDRPLPLPRPASTEVFRTLTGPSMDGVVAPPTGAPRPRASAEPSPRVSSPTIVPDLPEDDSVLKQATEVLPLLLPRTTLSEVSEVGSPNPFLTSPTRPIESETEAVLRGPPLPEPRSDVRPPPAPAQAPAAQRKAPREAPPAGPTQVIPLEQAPPAPAPAPARPPLPRPQEAPPGGETQVIPIPQAPAPQAAPTPAPAKSPAPPRKVPNTIIDEPPPTRSSAPADVDGPTTVRRPDPPPRPVAVASAPVRLGTDSDTDEEEPPRKRSWLGMFLGVGCLFVVIGGGALGYGGWYAWSRYQAGAAAEPAEPEPAVGAAGTAVEEPAPASAEPEPEPEPPAGPALTFRSASPETKKLSVNCDGTSASGAPEATLALEKASTCTITAIQTDRSRLTAKLSEAEAGSYTCFADGASVCKKD